MGEPNQPDQRRQRLPRGSGERLRADIIFAARALMIEAPDALSMRAVADSVGVTAPSIYRHFADKDDLVTAVVLDVFEELDAAMLAAGAGIDDPLERLHAYGLAYVRFAMAHPEHYRIATMDACPRPDIDQMLQEGAWVHMHDTVLACIAAGALRGDPFEVTLDLWAGAHGLAALMIAKPFMPWGDPDAAAERMLAALARGHADS